MVELIAAIILFIGLIGMGVIIIKKIPVLCELSIQEVKKPEGLRKLILRKLKSKIRDNGTLESFSTELLLQRILSRIRVLTLKTDKKTGVWLTKLHKRSLKKKNKFSDDYWQKLKRK